MKLRFWSWHSSYKSFDCVKLSDGEYTLKGLPAKQRLSESETAKNLYYKREEISHLWTLQFCCHTSLYGMGKFLQDITFSCGKWIGMMFCQEKNCTKSSLINQQFVCYVWRKRNPYPSAGALRIHSKILEGFRQGLLGSLFLFLAPLISGWSGRMRQQTGSSTKQ